jgi:hypothetical protein
LLSTFRHSLGSLVEPPEATESIVYAGLQNVERIIGEGIIIAEVHQVILNLGAPVVPQNIFGPDAEHKAADGLIDRASTANPANPRDDDAAADVCAGVSPGAARFAIDEPAIEAVAESRSKRGDPIEARASAGRRDHGEKSRSGGKDKRGVHAVLYGSPCHVRFDAQDPLRIDLVIEPHLTAAEKAAAAAVGPPRANVAANVEPAPVISERDW